MRIREAGFKARIRLNDYEAGLCPKHDFLDGSIHAIKANNYTVPAKNSESTNSRMGRQPAELLGNRCL
jgi:hypothetical protein